MTLVALIAGTYEPDRCGVAHYTARLRDALKQQQVESIVLTTHAAAQIAKDADVRGVVKGWQLNHLLPLVKAIHQSNADILHIQHAAGTYGFERAIFLLPLLLKVTGWRSPIVTTVHEYGWWEWQPKGIPPQVLEWLKSWGQKRYWWDREDGFLLTMSDARITTNQDAETAIASRLPEVKHVYQIPIAANVEVAPIERSVARQLLRQKCCWHQETTVIAFFGFLHPVKGLETLLPAFKKVQQAQPQARLLLVGGVESLALTGEDAKKYWDRLNTLIAELNLSGLVHLTGYVNAQTASYYISGADIGVLPFNHGVTLKSGSLLTLLAHSLPVIATQAPTTDSVPPLLPLSPSPLLPLLPPRNVDALATELLTLLNDSAKRYQLGKAGETFVQNLSWENIARSHCSIYPKLTRSI